METGNKIFIKHHELSSLANVWAKIIFFKFAGLTNKITCRTHVANGGLSLLMKLHQSNTRQKEQAKNPVWHSAVSRMQETPPKTTQKWRRARILLFARRVITTHTCNTNKRRRSENRNGRNYFITFPIPPPRARRGRGQSKKLLTKRVWARGRCSSAAAKTDGESDNIKNYIYIFIHISAEGAERGRGRCMRQRLEQSALEQRRICCLVCVCFCAYLFICATN